MGFRAAGDAVARMTRPLARIGLIMGMLSLAIMMLMVVGDVAGRSLLRRGITGTIDIIALTLMIVFFSSYAYVELAGKHIQVSVITDRFPRRVSEVLDVNGYFLSTAAMGLVTWRFFYLALNLRGKGAATSVLEIPTWPFVFLAGLFMGLFVLALLASLLRNIDSVLVHFGGRKGLLALLPGTFVDLGILAVCLWPQVLPFTMSRPQWGGLAFSFLFVLIFLRVHIGTAMVVSALLGLSYLLGPGAALSNVALSAVSVGSTITWSVAPLFMLMGFMVFYGGFAKELYEAAYRLVGHIAGGLCSATCIACAALAAVVGEPQTGVLTMGTLALPEMKERGYDPKLSTATICAAATVGMLIPPSIGFIIYGIIVEVSIGKLFIAGILPGILFTLILIVMITVMCRANPSLGPAGPKSTWRQRVESLGNTWAVVLLVVIVLGGIYGGVFTPTEAGAIGAFGALAIAAARRRLTRRTFVDALNAAVQMVGTIFIIFVFAMAVSHFLAATTLPWALADWVISLNLSGNAIMAAILFIYMLLGCLMNALPAVILTLPIFYPIAMSQGFDPVWFGVMIVVMVNLGQITPPIGMNVFAMSALAPDVPMYTIFRGVLPFWGAFLIFIIILVLFPQISLFLPNLMG
ncbi:TRAP transporter large permease subunit [Chloroflexota bacterium]